ncbi:MAG TPA: alkylhydroperoxidase domain protein [Propionicimonas sp.]|jgi:alkylhydroperoxidase domain protein|uniref:alkylhydroperoxidase domain protein n=1 Tax=Propionicimonas sp. TaxID=1955623 RepID=UPI002F3E2A3C
MTVEEVLRPVVLPPSHFTTAAIGWQPWLEPVAVDDLTAVQRDALIDAGRVKSEYFRVLAHDPAILKARTLTDNDIFYNPGAGLPRGEREFAAAATSRFNGCIFCASVHARFASHFLDDPSEVQRLLDDGVGADLSARHRAIVDAATALTGTPVSFGTGHVAALRDVGLDDQSIADLVHASAFFNWANRLMLSLGEPDATGVDL